jgi:membrane protein YdbS with pleckstrin-like domain
MQCRCGCQRVVTDQKVLGQIDGTTFQNSQIDVSLLPHVQELDFTPLEARYVRLRAGLALSALLAVLALYIAEGLVVFMIQGRDAWPLFLAGLVVLTGITIAYPWYRYRAARAMGYAVREQDIALRSGVFWLHQTIQPIRRVQHVELTRGPLEKRLGLARLSLYGAGSTGATFRIPGLSLRTASRLRRLVLRHSDQ